MYTSNEQTLMTTTDPSNKLVFHTRTDPKSSPYHPYPRKKQQDGSNIMETKLGDSPRMASVIVSYVGYGRYGIGLMY